MNSLELELPPLDAPPRLQARVLKSARPDDKSERTRPVQYRRSLMALLVLSILFTILGIYLVVAKTSPDLALYGERNGHREMLGRPVNKGQSATLFVDGPGKFSALALVANGRVVAEAKTHYPQ